MSFFLTRLGNWVYKHSFLLKSLVCLSTLRMFPTVWWFKYSNGVYMDVFRYFFNDCVLAVASKYLIPLLLLLVLPQASSSTLSSHHIISSWRSDFFFREIPIGPIQSLEVDNTRAFFFSIAVPQALSPGKCAAFWGKPEAALLLGVWSSLNRVGDPDQEEWHCFWRGVEGINAAFANIRVLEGHVFQLSTSAW